MNKNLKNKRRLNPYLIKKNRAYTFAEVAEIYDKHIRTIQQWRKDGLQVVDESCKPYLVMGSEVQRYLTRRNAKSRVPLKEGEFYCTKCRAAVTSLPENIRVSITGKKIGKTGIQAILKGICQYCNTSLRRFSTVEKITKMKIEGLMLTEHPLILIENVDHSPNTDIKEILE